MLGVDLYLKLDVSLAKRMEDLLVERNKRIPKGNMPETISYFALYLIKEKVDELEIERDTD